ncbi:MAG: hypothetical protein Q9186_004315 [Xanthomendoza sp. 1 TL-2023]
MVVSIPAIESSTENEPRYVKSDSFDRFLEVHATRIRYEFHQVHQKIDTGFAALDVKFDQLNNRFTIFEASVDQRFHSIDQRFQSIDQRFQSIDQRFQSIDQRFQSVDQKFQCLELDLRHLKAYFRNSKLTRLHQSIHIIYILDSSLQPIVVPVVPPYFPKNVKAFLGLRDHISSLASLCRSYDCCDWNTWHLFEQDDTVSDTDSSSSRSECPRTLEDAVALYPELALRELGEALGLDLDRLDEKLRQYDEFSIHSRALYQPRKRASHSPSLSENVKRQRPLPLSKQKRPSPPPPKAADPEFIKLLLREKSSSSPQPDSSIHTQLGWAAATPERVEDDDSRASGSCTAPNMKSPQRP